MTDLISRQMAIHVLRKMLYKLEDEREKYYIKEKKADEWFFYIRPNMQDMNDLDVEAIDSLPSANPWYTGTPTEIKGWYLLKYKWYDEIRYITMQDPAITFFVDSRTIGWQKIEEKNNGHTD